MMGDYFDPAYFTEAPMTEQPVPGAFPIHKPTPFSASGKQFAWDSTSLGWLKECPRKYKFAMLEGWRTREKDLSVHLFFGLIYQKALETFDRLRAQGMSHEDALADVVMLVLRKTWLPEEQRDDFTVPAHPWESEDTNKTRFTLLRSVVWHIEEYSDDRLETLILSDGTPAVELNFKLEVGGIMLCGHLDRVVKWDGDIYVLDHKTTKSAIGGYYFQGFRPDNQMSLYALAASIIFNQPIAGIIIDAAQIMVGFTRFARGFTHRTEAELEEWLAESRFHIDQAHRYADCGVYPLNDKSCHHYSGCEFQHICSSDPRVRGKLLEAQFEKREWNPLVPREA